MPQALVFIGQAIAVGASAAVGALTAIGLSQAAAVFIVDIGLKLAGLQLLNSIYRKYFLPDIGTSPQSFTITSRGTIEHSRIIYGETLSSGLIWYMNSAGTNNQHLFYGIAVAGHPVVDFTDMWINDNRIPEGYINWDTDGAVNSGDFRGDNPEVPLYFVRKYGGNDQAADNYLLRPAFSEITSQHQGRGIAYFVARLTYIENTANVWSNGAPQNLRALVKGKRVYDPRSDSSQPFGTGPHQRSVWSTWEWSDNPALCWADYMRDDDLGFGEDSDRIDWGYVASAANICEEVVYTPVGTDKRYRCNGTLSTGDTHRENISRILSSMNGSAVLMNGTWRVRAYGYETPTLQFTDDDLRDDLEIQLVPKSNERYNTVRGVFVDKDRLWKSNEFPEITSSEYVARDGGVLYNDIRLAMTKENFQAQRLAFNILEQSDNMITVKAPLKYHAMPAEIGGTIMLSNEAMNWTDKVFRVERYAFGDQNGIDMVLREDSSAAYAEVGTAEYTVLSGGIYTATTVEVPPPSALSVEGKLEGIQISITPPAARLYETVEIHAVAGNNDRNSADPIVSMANDKYLFPTNCQEVYFFWARSKDYLGEYSDWLPNSTTTDVFASINTAVSYAQVETTGTALMIPDQGSGWDNAAIITGPTINAGGAAPIKADITLEVTIVNTITPPSIGDEIRVRFQSDRGGNLSTFGPEKKIYMPEYSVGLPSWYTLKAKFETTVNTNDTMRAAFLATHPSSLEAFHAITDYSYAVKVIPDPTATTNPGPADVTQRIVGETIVLTDNQDADLLSRGITAKNKIRDRLLSDTSDVTDSASATYIEAGGPCTAGPITATLLDATDLFGGPTDVGYRTDTDGYIYTQPHEGSFSIKETWNTGSCVASNFQVRIQKTSGDNELNPTGPIVNSWYNLTTDREWHFGHDDGGVWNWTGNIAIRRRSDNTVVASNSISMEHFIV